MKALTRYENSVLVAPYATDADADAARRLLEDVEDRAKVLIAQDGTLHTNTWERALYDVVAAYRHGAAKKAAALAAASKIPPVPVPPAAEPKTLTAAEVADRGLGRHYVVTWTDDDGATQNRVGRLTATDTNRHTLCFVPLAAAGENDEAVWIPIGHIKRIIPFAAHLFDSAGEEAAAYPNDHNRVLPKHMRPKCRYLVTYRDPFGERKRMAAIFQGWHTTEGTAHFVNRGFITDEATGWPASDTYHATIWLALDKIERVDLPEAPDGR